MKKRIFIVLLAAVVAIMPVAFLCSCNGCSSKTANTSAAVQDVTEVQVKPAPAAEKEIIPAEQPAEMESVEPVAAEPIAEEKSAPAAATEEEEEESAEELVEVKTSEQEETSVVETESTAVEKEMIGVVNTEDPAEKSAAEKVPVQESAQFAESDEKNCGGHIITLGLSPWGWQYFHTDESGMDDENSTYGLGGKLAYTYLFSNGFYVGAEAAYETYFIDDKDNFSDIMFFVDGGYNFTLTDRLGLYAGLGGGLELECYKDTYSAVGVLKADFGLGYSLAEHWIVGAGCDFIFGFPMKSGTSYMEFQIIPCIMGSYRF